MPERTPAGGIARSARAVASARKRLEVGAPRWSATTRSSSRVAPRLSMVSRKFLPRGPYTQVVRSTRCLQPARAAPRARPRAGAAVLVQRAHRVVLVVRGALRAVEDVVGRAVHEQRAQPPRLSREHPGATALIAWAARLGPVDGGVGRRVHDQAGREGAADALERARAAQVERGPVGGVHLAQRRQGARQLEAHLPLGAGEEDAHQAKVSACANGVPFAAFAGRIGCVPPRGHSMPTAGSFQSSERSCAGA